MMLALLASAAAAQDQPPIRPRHADMLVSTSPAVPPPEAAWRRIDLPFNTDQPSAWYRMKFEAPASPDPHWAVYLPYLYRGGLLMLNGVPLLHLADSNAQYMVRTERPYLVPIPETALKPGTNELLLRLSSETGTARYRMPLLAIGPAPQLRSHFEWRLFWVRTMPQFTVVACTVVGLLVLFIWWRRREESLYGLFGIAALLWGGRTLTFIIETLPTPLWGLWRLFYHSATGGFIIVLMVFSLRLAERRLPRLEQALFGYWLLGPIGYAVSGGSETLTGRIWAGGLIPIGIGILVMSGVAAWRQRTVTLVALSAAIALAVAAGFNDYLLAASSSLLPATWKAHRIFLLHYAADVLLLVMGAILSARFVVTLQAIEQLNRTLESRVAVREKTLSENFAQLGRLERQHAADEERQRIMRDLHDGLGSQLFVTLSRVEAGGIGQDETAQALRDCIADMRLALEAMSPDGNDFLEAWGNFRFRWQAQLQAAGVRSSWEVEADEDVIELPSHAGLQLLRIAQEALTNVLKHSHARDVRVRLAATPETLRLEVIDDGRGLCESDARIGKGLANMKARAVRLGAQLHVEPSDPGTNVWVEIPRPATQAPAAAS